MVFALDFRQQMFYVDSFQKIKYFDKDARLIKLPFISTVPRNIRKLLASVPINDHNMFLVSNNYVQYVLVLPLRVTQTICRIMLS